MALKPEMEAALAKIPDEKYRTSMREALEANQTFADGWLRQADYDRNMNAFKVDKAKHDDWFKKADAEYVGMVTKVDELTKAVTDRDAKVADLEHKVSSGDYTPGQEEAMGKEIESLKSTIGNFNKQIEGLNKQFGDFGTKFIDRDTLNKEAQGVISFMTENFFALGDLAVQYHKDFGKSFSKEDRQALIKFVDEENAKGNTMNFEQAYKAKYSDDLDKVKETQMREKILREERTKNNLPIAGDSAPLLGPLQSARMKGKFDDGLAPDAPMDAVAAAAAQSLRSEGKY